MPPKPEQSAHDGGNDSAVFKTEFQTKFSIQHVDDLDSVPSHSLVFTDQRVFEPSSLFNMSSINFFN